MDLKSISIKERRKMRICALKLFYQIKNTEEELNALNEIAEYNNYEYVKTLLDNSFSNKYGDIVNEFLINKTIKELDLITQGCIILGCVELENFIEIPYRVIISEYVSLAQEYGNNRGFKIVNAILEKSAEVLRDKKIVSIEEDIFNTAKYEMSEPVFLPTYYGEFYIRYLKFNKEYHILITKNQEEFNEDEFITTRIHSECFTGDCLYSLRCDCYLQLQKSMQIIESRGKGLIFYLKQEGRGIGLINKLLAYKIQDEKKLDTVDANKELKLPVDNRDYKFVTYYLNKLGIKKVLLLTNNMEKVKDLQDSNLVEVKREALIIEANKYNKKYLKTKKDKMDHLLP